MLDTRTPPVTTHQIIRFLADNHASHMKWGRFYSRQDDDPAREYCVAHYRAASHYRQTIALIKSGDIATWLIGRKENTP